MGVVVALVLVCVAAAIAVGIGTSAWAAVAVGLAALAGAGLLIGADSAARGRTPVLWLLACGFLPPIGIPAFIVIAIRDRAAGRPGMEAAWPKPWRLPLLASTLLLIGAAVIALTPVQVQGITLSFDGGSASFSGQCGAPLSVAVGVHPFTGPIGAPGAPAPTPVTAAQATVANRCFTATGHRLAASLFLLIAAIVTLAGSALRRDRHSLPSVNAS